MIDHASSDEEAGGEDDGNLDADGIWGERAQSLVAFVASAKPPVKRSTLATFAMRKGWEQKTLDGCLDYCVEKKLLARFTSFSGEKAWKIPLTPVHEDDGGVDAAVNYGCPEHGAARRGAEENKTMAKDWITTAEAGQLLGIRPNRVMVRIHEGKIDAEIDESYTVGGRKPFRVKRSSVIAFRDSRGKNAAKDLIDEPKAKPAKRIAAKTVRAPKAAPPAVAVDLADDVRALRRNVERRWMTIEQAWAALGELVS